jgi:ring-1,2-phenylacetyl-CoA epoxidase subunit PaaC
LPSHQQGAAHLSTSADTAGSLGPAPHASAAALLPYLLSLADDALVLGHRLSEWSGRGPTLEEDIALSNLALDLIGQARLYYSYAGELEGRGRDEDALAYCRDEHAYRNLLLLEQPNGDFAMTMARHLLYAAFLDPYFKALSASADPRLAEIGAKAAKEMAYHLRHAAEWVIRLGDGTEESRARTAAALDELWMYTGEMFEMDAGETALSAQGIAVDRASIRPAWEATLARVLAEATLARPADRWMQRGGRAGQHSEHLGRLLAEMQVVHRAHPGASW